MGAIVTYHLIISSDKLERAGISGTALPYVEQGQGESVVCVHGSLGDLRIWQPLLPAIGSEHRAIRYSRRYAQPNEQIPAAFVRQLGTASAHLVGNSQGSSMCSSHGEEDDALSRRHVRRLEDALACLSSELISSPPSTLKCSERQALRRLLPSLRAVVSASSGRIERMIGSMTAAIY
jgi:pimeloyl-ACP methyl ester carboxylesterase